MMEAIVTKQSPKGDPTLFDPEFEEKVRVMSDDQDYIVVAAYRARKAGDEALRESLLKRLVENDFSQRELLRNAAAKYAALTRPNKKLSEEQWVAQLVEAFVIGAKLLGLWDDAMGQIRISTRFERKLYKLGETLAWIGTGRLDRLAVFLDHPNPNLRVAAAVKLMPLDPERCVRILRDIARSNTLCAGRYAMRMTPYQCRRCAGPPAPALVSP
jgi:HEAT repeat protein